MTGPEIDPREVAARFMRQSRNDLELADGYAQAANGASRTDYYLRRAALLARYSDICISAGYLKDKMSPAARAAWIEALDGA